MSETGKISEALADLKYWEITHAVWKIGNRLTGFDTKKDEIFAAIKAALPLAEQLEAEVVSLRAELEQAKSVKNVSDELQRMQTEFFPAIAWLHELFAIALMQRSIIKQKLELVDLRAQVEELTADKARLDWITSSPVEVVPSSIKYFLFQHPPTFKTPREAIDAAMKESQ